MFAFNFDQANFKEVENFRKTNLELLLFPFFNCNMQCMHFFKVGGALSSDPKGFFFLKKICKSLNLEINYVASLF